MRTHVGWGVAFVAGCAVGGAAMRAAPAGLCARAAPHAASPSVALPSSVAPPAELYIDAERFYVPGARYYAGEVDDVVYKRAALMARILYPGTHEDERFPEHDPRRGLGRNFATWVFSEQPPLDDRLFSTALDLVIDSRLEPRAAIGLHVHDRSEELYYVLEGTIEMTVVRRDGREVTRLLGPGDAHGVRLGEAHYGRAGPQGCRFIAVAVKKPG